MAQAMSQLFLDIDGVLNHSVVYTQFDYPRLFPEHCALLNHIIATTGCSLVLQSNWKHLLLLGTISQYLRTAGITAPLIGATPYIGKRGSEVRAYRGESREPYVILDDLADYFPDQPLVLTQNEAGLTTELAEIAIDILTRGKS